jgi:hypothetical protein
MLKTNKKSITLLFATSILIGCTPMSWYKPVIQPGEFEKAKYECTQQAQQPYGQSTFGYYYYGGSSINTVITNENLFAQCMNAKGWKLQNKEKTDIQVQQQQITIDDKKSELDKAASLVCSNPEFSAYYAKSPCKASEISFSQLADKTKITSSQKNVLLKQIDAVGKLNALSFQTQIQLFGQLGQKRADLFKSTAAPADEKNNLNLYNGLITWGEYNQIRKDIHIKFVNDANNIK